MNTNVLVSLSEGDKRVILAIIFIFIILFVIVGLIGKLIQVIMRYQGQKIDEKIGEALHLNVIKDKKHFLKYSRKKNWRMFYKQAWIPLLIILVATLILIIHHTVTNDWSYNLWDPVKTGFNTLFYTWDFGNPDYYTTVWGLPFKVLKEWPALLTSPHFSKEAWCSYVFIPLITIGCIWYLIVIQGAIARTIRVHKLARKIYSQKLDDFNAYTNINTTKNDDGNNIPPSSNINNF